MLCNAVNVIVIIVIVIIVIVIIVIVIILIVIISIVIISIVIIIIVMIANIGLHLLLITLARIGVIFPVLALDFSAFSNLRLFIQRFIII